MSISNIYINETEKIRNIIKTLLGNTVLAVLIVPEVLKQLRIRNGISVT